MEFKIKDKWFHLLILVLSSMGIIFWLHAISIPNIYQIDISHEFGLFEVLPITFHFSIIFLTVSTLLSCYHKKEKFFLANILVLSLVLFGTGVFVEKYPRFWDTYLHGRVSKYIMENGIIRYENMLDEGLDYLQWPGFFIVTTMLMKTTNISLMSFLKFYPIFSVPLIILSVYLLFRGLFWDVIIAKITTLIFLLLNQFMITQIHFCPQSLGLILYSLIIYTLIKESVGYRIVSIFLLLALIISHPTTSVFIMLFIIIVYLFGHLPLNRSENFTAFKNFSLVLFIVIAFMSWQIYLAAQFFDYNASGVRDALVKIINWEGRTSTVLSRGSLFLPSLINQMFFFGTYLLTGCYLFLKILKKKIFPVFTSAWFIVPSIFFISDILMEGLFGMRSALFAFYPICFLIGEFTSEHGKNKKYSLMVKFLPLFFLLAASTLYFAESMYLYSEGDIQAYRFAYDMSKNKTFAGDVDPHLFTTAFVYLTGIDYENVDSVQLDLDALNNQSVDYDVILISDRNIIYSLVHYGKTRDEMKKTIENINSYTYLDRIYDNKKCQIYDKNQDGL